MHTRSIIGPAASSGADGFSAYVAEGDRKLWGTFWIFIIAGVVLTLTNLSLPITRNAFCYAKAALGIVQYHFNVLAIAKDVAWTCGKPILFSVFAAPLVWLFNANTGTVIASALGTTFFLWMVALALRRLNRRSGLDPSLLPLEFVLVSFNPLVIYQFWSAYPDSLFAGMVLLAFILTDIIATELKRDTRWQIVGLGITIVLAINTKLYGAILGLICPLYLLMHGRRFAASSQNLRSKVSVLAGVLGVVVVVLLTAKFNVNPLLEFSEGGGYGGYGDHDVMGSLSMFAFSVSLSLQAALLFLLRRAAWRAWAPAPTTFVAIYLLGLIWFDGTVYNMRYFLPVFPFLAPALAAGSRSVGPLFCRAVMGAYGATAFMLVSIFNIAPVEEIVDPVLSQATARHGPLSYWLDNLRIPVQIALRKKIEAINAQVPPGGTFYWSSDYYGTATHGLAEHLGIKGDLDIRYVLYPLEIPAPPGPVFLTVFGVNESRARLQPDWATVRRLRSGIFRLDPISVSVISTSGDHVAERDPVRLQVKIATGKRFAVNINIVEFLEGEEILGTAERRPFELNWQAPAPGRHEIVARVRYGDGDVLVSKPIAVYVGIPGLERATNSGGNLAVEVEDGSVVPVDDTLEIGSSGSTTGLYFDRLYLRQGVSLAKAYLEFEVADPESQPTALEIQAELSGDAPSFKFEKDNLSRRLRTTSSVKWEPNPWIVFGTRKRSADLVPILKEVIGQKGWRSGNAIVLLIHGSGRRSAQSLDEGGRAGPTLYVELQHN